MGFFSNLFKSSKTVEGRRIRDPKKDKVLWKKGSQVYHLFSFCIESSDPDNIQKMTEYQAINKGLRCCKKM